MDGYIENEIIKIVSSFRQLPYLFVGTGLSMRYANAPSWKNLLFGIWSRLNDTKSEYDFERIVQGIERDIKLKYGDLSKEEQKYYINPILATKIEEEFCSLYFNNSSFYTSFFSKEQNEEIIHNHYNPFKYYVAKVLDKIKVDITKPDYPEIKDLVINQNKIAGIITTNYDNILENTFSDFSVMIGQDNMLVSNTFNIFEIFKIHGCVTCPDSIVLTEKDYCNFESKLKYLSAKLLTIFVEHPIIFLGYGMGDINIRKIFQEIAECLNPEQLEKVKNNFIFVTPAFGKKEQIHEKEIVFGKKVITMKELVLNNYSYIYNALSSIQSSMPIKLARKLQDMVCNFVYSTSAKNNIIFGDINSPDIDDNKTAVYFGRTDIVTQMGFSYFTIDDILEDILYDNKPYLINIQLIEKTFKNIRSSAGTTLLPIYKYIFKLNYNKNKISKDYNIIKSYEDIKPTSSQRKNYLKNKKIISSIQEIEREYPDHILKQVAYIKEFAEELSVTELEQYLKKYFYTEEYQKNKSQFRRLIALYDFKKYNNK